MGKVGVEIVIGVSLHGACWVMTSTPIPHVLWTTMQCTISQNAHVTLPGAGLDGCWTELSTLNLTTSLLYWVHGPEEGKVDILIQGHSAHFPWTSECS